MAFRGKGNSSHSCPPLDLLPQTGAAVHRRVQAVEHVRAVGAGRRLDTTGATTDASTVVVAASGCGAMAQTGTADTGTGRAETAVVVVVMRSRRGARVRGVRRVVVVVVRQTGTGSGTDATRDGGRDVVLVGSRRFREVTVDAGVELVQDVVAVGTGGVGRGARGGGLRGRDVGGRVDATAEVVVVASGTGRNRGAGGVLAVIGMQETHDGGL